MPYYLRLNERENCTYKVTAYYQPLSSTSTAANMPAKVRSLGNGKYVVDPIPYTKLSQYAYSWRLVVNVEKVSQNAEEVSVSRYLELNDKTMMLITVKGTPEGGKAFTYNGNTMYKVNAYGTDQYAWLVIVDKGQTLTQEEAAAKVAISAADNVVTITLGFDVNMTGKVDVNDAQLVYDMYNGTYSDFTKVSVEKFLRADVNATKVVDHTDAVAIVNSLSKVLPASPPRREGRLSPIGGFAPARPGKKRPNRSEREGDQHEKTHFYTIGSPVSAAVSAAHRSLCLADRQQNRREPQLQF